MAFFVDRNRFESYADILGPERKEMYLGAYDNDIYLRHGDELPSIRDIPRQQS